MLQKRDRETAGQASSGAIALAALLLVLLASAPSSAVVVLPKNSSQPVLGYLVRQDDAGVIVRTELPGGKSREMRFSTREIDELIITVDPQRLAKLNPEQPELYREYAEELAEKQRDPEARDMAVRLYAIAAARGSGSLRRGALLGLISLARNPAEERKFRAAAYQFDPQHDAAILSASPAAKPKNSSPQGREELAAALALIRQGKPDAAQAFLERPAAQAELDSIAAATSRAQLAEMCAARSLTAAQLLQLLRAEVAIADVAAERAAPTALVEKTAAAWSREHAAERLAPLPPLSLDRLTEFDPAECLFRGGKWVRP